MPQQTTPEQPDGVRRSSFSSRDEGEVTDFIGRMYAENRSHFDRVRAGARFSAQTHDTDVLGSDRLRTSIDYSGTSEGFTDYTFFVVHAGSVEQTSRAGSVRSAAGDVALYPLHLPIEFRMQHFDVTTLRLPVDRVARVAEETVGLPASQLRLHSLTPVSASMHRYWRSLLAHVSGALMDRESPLSSPLLAENLARTVATAALEVFPSSTMTQQHLGGPGFDAPAVVRRAVAHIEANADRPLALGEIAEAAGTSPRSLQHGFRRHLGTTPLGHVRRVRLELAHAELRRADPTRGDTVAAVASRWGFANPGRFAAAYRDVFGVLPGETLRR